MKILVHLHLYYFEQLDFMLEKLKNISGCNWDLYVTICKNNKEISEKILKFKSDAKIMQVENRGYDIWPFLQVLKIVNPKEYDLVLKIHTKKTERWRNTLIQNLLGTSTIFQNNLKIFEKNPRIGILTSKDYCWEIYDDNEVISSPEDKYLLAKMKQRLNITSKYKYFCAGSMFLVRTSILNKLILSDINESDFPLNATSGTTGTNAHTIERIISLLADQNGYKIHKINSSTNIKQAINNFMENLFSLKNEYRNRKQQKYKTLKILGIKFKFKMKYSSPYSISYPENEKRTAIFAHYDKNNKIQDYVVYYLQELKKVANNIIFVSDNNLSSRELSKIKNIVSYSIAQKHGEYDFGSYKRGFLYAKDNGYLNNIKELIFANDSCYGPLFPFDIMFDDMSIKPVDFWGVTFNVHGLNPNIKNQGHIQSYFVVFKPQIFNSEIFNNFICSIKKEEIKEKIIENYEIGLSRMLIKAGFNWDVYFEESKKDNFKTCNLFVEYYDLAIKNNVPLIKTSILRGLNEDLVNSKEAFRYVKKHTSYNISLIEKDLLYNKKYIKPKILKSIFSIKNSYTNFKQSKHKVISILGLKFKIKVKNNITQKENSSQINQRNLEAKELIK